MTSSIADLPRARLQSAAVSLVSAIAILIAKFVAWHMTGSTAVFSDALESVVNVLAAGFAVFSLRLAASPADDRFPNGYGRLEHLSAFFEGSLVLLAAVWILWSGAHALWMGTGPRELDWGLAVMGAAGAANFVL